MCRYNDLPLNRDLQMGYMKHKAASMLHNPGLNLFFFWIRVYSHNPIGPKPSLCTSVFVIKHFNRSDPFHFSQSPTRAPIIMKMAKVCIDSLQGRREKSPDSSLH